MTDFDSVALLNVGHQSISLAQALHYLQRSGKLMTFINEIVGQHILSQELQSRSDLSVSISELETQAQAFREKQELTDSQSFDQWLSSRGLTYGTFHNLMSDDLKLEKLKLRVSEESASTYFSENRADLDEIKLTYIVLTDEAKAYEFRRGIDSENKSFGDIATECINAAFIDESKDVSLKKETLRRGQLRQELKDVIIDHQPGEVLGPITVGEGDTQRWWLLTIDSVEPATFEGELKQKLEIELFRQWLTQRMQENPIELIAS